MRREFLFKDYSFLLLRHETRLQCSRLDFVFFFSFYFEIKRSWIVFIFIYFSFFVSKIDSEFPKKSFPFISSNKI